MPSENNIHYSAVALIIEAARRSGLLGNIAEVLLFAAAHPHWTCDSGGRCVACEVLDRLADEFDRSHATLVVDDIFGDGIDTSPPADRTHELAAFTG